MRKEETTCETCVKMGGKY